METECGASWVPHKTGRIFLIGNGGSSAVAAHIANDLVKQGHSAFSLSEPAILTCLSNDYGYDRVYVEQLKAHENPGDTLVAISSSGQSQNILKAVTWAVQMQMEVVTLSGFDANNPLRHMGDINYWVPSHNYGVVEVSHLAILHSVVLPNV